MSVDEIRDAVERTVPSYSGRTGDWDGVLAAVSAANAPTPRRRWIAPALAASAAVAAVALFWPGGGDGERVLERALAAVDGGPVVHLVLRSGTNEFYDLQRRVFRRIPIIHELWVDDRRGIHSVQRVGDRVFEDVLWPPGRTEVDRQYLGLADAYRTALMEGAASVGDEGEVDGRPVYWIEFTVRYPDVGIPVYEGKHSVAVDAKTYEPVLWRADGPEYPILRWETLPAGRGDFTAARTMADADSSPWSGVARVGMRTPAQARGALSFPALWLGQSFQDLPLAFIREVRYETGMEARVQKSLPGLELCYGRGEPCYVLVSQTTEPHPFAGRGHGWAITPPPGSVGFTSRGHTAYLVRDGLYVSMNGRGQEELIAAAEALTPIP